MTLGHGRVYLYQQPQMKIHVSHGRVYLQDGRVYLQEVVGGDLQEEDGTA